METFPISYSFAEKYIRFSNPEYLQLYLYLSYLTAKNGCFPKTEQLAKDLDLPAERVLFILDFWVSRDELIYDQQGYRFPDSKEKPIKPVSPQRKRTSRPSYSMAEIDAVAANNKSVSGLFYQAETVLHKVLTQSDMEMLYSFVDWLGLPVEVITMLLSYAEKRGKTNRRYLETVAIDWAERGINSFEAAEAHITVLENADSFEREIRNILGIYDRALSPTEKKYLKLWSEEERLSAPMIALAYDRTVTRTGKLSWAYMHKILEQWVLDGYTSVEEINAGESSRPVKTDNLPQKSKFNNYDDTNKIDYSKLEEQLLDMMLDEEV